MGTYATDAELIAASLRDARLFTRIFDRHYVEIHAYVQRRLGQRLAGQVAARTFVEAFHGRDRFAGGADARPWLYGIATRIVGTRRRHETRRLRRYARRGPSPFNEALLAAREHGTTGSMVRLLARGIARVPGRDRDVLLLGCWAGLRDDQIAEALGCSQEDVAAGRARARRRAAGPASAGVRVAHGREARV